MNTCACCKIEVYWLCSHKLQESSSRIQGLPPRRFATKIFAFFCICFAPNSVRNCKFWCFAPHPTLPLMDWGRGSDPSLTALLSDLKPRVRPTSLFLGRNFPSKMKIKILDFVDAVLSFSSRLRCPHCYGFKKK